MRRLAPGLAPRRGREGGRAGQGTRVMLRRPGQDRNRGTPSSPAEFRNPFLAVTPPAATPDAPSPTRPPIPTSDPLADIVAGLSLDATFLQGRDQLAIINGRIYHKGQELELPGDDESRPALLVLFVKPTGVILKGGGKNYLLGYPEHLGKKPDDGAKAAAREAEAEHRPGGPGCHVPEAAQLAPGRAGQGPDRRPGRHGRQRAGRVGRRMSSARSSGPGGP